MQNYMYLTVLYVQLFTLLFFQRLVVAGVVW
jgi:hypothetical protein